MDTPVKDILRAAIATLNRRGEIAELSKQTDPHATRRSARAHENNPLEGQALRSQSLLQRMRNA
jgi:hypothetical protein